MSGKSTASDYVQPWHYYPSLFESAEEEIVKHQEEQETEQIKALMKAKAEAWNRRYKEKIK